MRVTATVLWLVVVLRARRPGARWLRADLTLWGKWLATDTAQAGEVVRRPFHHWQEAPDLAGVRDGAALANLLDSERAGWQQLWADVEAVVKESTAARK